MRDRNADLARVCIAVGVIVCAVLVEAHVWRWPWIRTLSSWLDIHLVSVTAVVILGLLISYSPISRRLRSSRHEQRSRKDAQRWPWVMSDSGIFTVVGLLACAGVIALIEMLHVANGLVAGVDRAKLQIDAIKYGLGSVAAGGAAAALLLAIRRQRHAEQVHVHTVDDAAERRVTELYAKAVEQLGSTDAAVRLGGLYSLERVAQNNIGQRQTVVNVVCAYLRMPYRPPESNGDPVSTGTPETEPRNSPSPSEGTSATNRDPVQETQVRLAAQRILSAHARNQEGRTPADSPYWDVQLDLSGAVLIDMSLNGASLRQATFARATFVGDANFDRATFNGGVSFSNATFRGTAGFSQAVFGGEGNFGGAWFGGPALFTESTFSEAATFESATFLGVARFGEATLTRAAFVGARFEEPVQFGKAAFPELAVFSDVDFRREARFGQTQFAKCKFLRSRFGGDAWFGRASFSEFADFGGARFNGGALFIEARFEADAKFGEAVFDTEVSFARTKFGGLANFGGASFAVGTFTAAQFFDRAWFVAAGFSDVGVFDDATFSGDCSFAADLPADAVELGQARIQDRPDRNDKWPKGWLPKHPAPAAENGFFFLDRELSQGPSKRGDIID